MKDLPERSRLLDTGRGKSRGWKYEEKVLSAVVNGRRLLANHPYKRQWVRVIEAHTTTYSDCRESDVLSPYVAANQMSPEAFITGFDPYVNQWAFNKLVEKTGSQAELLVLVDIAELHKTADMLLSAVTDLKRLFTAVTRMKPKRAKAIADKYARRHPQMTPKHLARVKKPTFTDRPVPAKVLAERERLFNKRRSAGSLYFKEASEKWLTYRYGIMPLIGSIESSLKLIQGKRKTVRVNGSARHHLVQRRTDSNGSVSYWNPVVQSFFTGNVRVAYKGEMSVKNKTLAQMRDAGVSNPLETIYELIPFSFVVDWVYDVGSWISNLDPFIGVEFSDMTITHQFIGVSEVWDYPPTSPQYKGKLPQLHAREAVKSKRVILHNYPLSPQVLLEGGLLTKWRRSIDILTFLNLKLGGHKTIPGHRFR